MACSAKSFESSDYKNTISGSLFIILVTCRASEFQWGTEKNESLCGIRLRTFIHSVAPWCSCLHNRWTLEGLRPGGDINSSGIATGRSSGTRICWIEYAEPRAKVTSDEWGSTWKKLLLIGVHRQLFFARSAPVTSLCACSGRFCAQRLVRLSVVSAIESV